MRKSLLGLLTVALLSAGCTSTTDEHTDHAMASEVVFEEQWASAGDGEMAAVFGTLVNNGHHEARVVSGSSPAAGRVEVHEVAGDAGAKTMRPKEGGIVLPAGGSHELVPGGDHLMLMDLTAPLAVGSDIELTVQFEDGSTLPVTVQVRDFAGANEEYQPEHGGHG
ncbi:copper chaperone PCu(A)C [Mycolicibacterium frederiksbergense]|uniref:Copper chaperone PCu(A)C n=1 Tax=Mycolicibacterium frederiksbergense TaxID=117567 RepID=A0A6H0S9T0_9MYCO|nr:copper chaperone PCu(A)C [Mycolicibacterium frederiksbergense]QIV83179.1 copper chaperone PCu(A)C [Mycolicibacterium frederiksbergense]